jgi:hypothetical protein
MEKVLLGLCVCNVIEGRCLIVEVLVYDSSEGSGVLLMCAGVGLWLCYGWIGVVLWLDC